MVEEGSLCVGNLSANMKKQYRKGNRHCTTPFGPFRSGEVLIDYMIDTSYQTFQQILEAN